MPTRPSKGSRLRPMPMACLAAPLPAQVAWRSVPSTYIICTDNQIITLPAQRSMAAQAGAVIEIDSDHSPFLSCPGELAHALAGIAAKD